jgi:hypothetical protein
VLALGCGGDEFGRDMASIKGKVTAKGAPVQPTAKTLFLMFEKMGQRPESIEVMSDGTFSGNAPIGPNKVKLQIYGDIPGLKKDFSQEVTVESGKTFDFEVGE